MPKYKITVKRYEFADADVEVDNIEQVKRIYYEHPELFTAFDSGYFEIMGIDEIK